MQAAVRFALLICIVIASAVPIGEVPAADWTLSEMIGQDERGRPIYRGRPLDERFTNPWSAELEAEFQARARDIIAEQMKRRVPAGNTYFENEKRTYGYLMAQVLGGRTQAIADLQHEDAQGKSWHHHTHGIDFYACFTLKHQMRKYFYFGDLLAPEYRQRMYEGGQAWTTEDPLRRPHHAYAGKTGWGPDAKNSWVDVRTTENLYLMRVTSVYLMAEETGNRDVSEKYKKEIRRYVTTLYRVGMGEWDSENYHGHSIPPLLNLYDFAEDDEVRLLAKAALDWLFTAGAVKYYRGGFNGPTKRDYNHVQPFGGSAAAMLWVAFGDSPNPNRHWESDEVHLITSQYRPPMAVVALARKEFQRPAEILATKPPYTATTSGDATSPPEYHETHYFGRTFQMGSLAEGTSAGKGDTNGFKILVYSEDHGARAIQGVPGSDPRYVGSPQYQEGKISAANRVAQYRDTAIWLVEDGSSPWCWVVPREIKVLEDDGVTLLRGDRTWVALHPLNLEMNAIDSDLTHQIAEEWPDHQVLSARGLGNAYCGFAVHVGEEGAYADFAEFRMAALRDFRVDTVELERGVVACSIGGREALRMDYAPDEARCRVQRNGRPHDWDIHGRFLYTPVGHERRGPIRQERNGAPLSVEAGGHRFICAVDEYGNLSFRNEAAR